MQRDEILLILAHFLYLNVFCFEDNISFSVVVAVDVLIVGLLITFLFSCCFA